MDGALGEVMTGAPSYPGTLPRSTQQIRHSGPLQIQHPLLRKFPVCRLMIQKYAFR